MNGNYDIAKYFIDKGIKLTKYHDRFGGDLHWAVHEKHYDIVKLLLESGAEFETDVKEDTENPFFCAVERKQYQIVELFLQKGTSPNFYVYGDGYMITPLHLATQMKDIKMASILLKYNANVNAKMDNNNKRFIKDTTLLTPMDIAVFNQDVEMQKLLESFGGIVSSKEEKIQSILEHYDEDNEKYLQLKKLLKS